MNEIKDIFIVQKIALNRLIESLKKMPQIPLLGVIFYVLLIIISFLLSLPITIGIPLEIILIFNTIFKIFSSFIYLKLLQNVINYHKIKIKDFKSYFNDRVLLYKVITIIFLTNIITYLLSIFNIDQSTAIIYMAITVIAYIFFNPITESLYLKNYDPMSSLKYTANFTKENWISWLLPTFIFLIIYNIITGNDILNINNLILFYIVPPIHLISFQLMIKGILQSFLFTAIHFTFMIYRAHLFKILSETNINNRNGNIWRV